MIRQFLAGRTYSLVCNFFDDVGTRTSVDSPTITIYTPQRTVYTEAALTADSLTIGKYSYNFHVASGLTYGYWFGIGAGITASTTIFSESVPFEVINIATEPFWVGLSEFREYIEVPDTDHSKDGFYKQVLQTAIELVEAYTRRTFGVRSYSETIEIRHTESVALKHFPVISITALTATSQITPMDATRFTETVTNQLIPFYYRMDYANGIVKLTDSAGFADTYDGTLLAIDYQAGFMAIPEPVRQAVMMLASKLANLATSEGIDSVSLADLSFTLDKGLMDGPITELLSEYRLIGGL